MLGILDDIDLSKWKDKDIVSALNFLYGNADAYADNIVHMNVIGRHKERTNFKNSFDNDDDSI